MTVRFGSWRKKTRKFDRWRSASPNDTCFVVTGKGDAAQGWHLVLAELGSVADTGPMGVVRPGREQCDRHKLTAWIKALVAVVTALVSVAATASASHALPVWDTSPVQVTRNVKPTPKVVDPRVGEHRNFDRVVIDLAGKVPGYTVKYTRMLTYEGSGEAVPLKAHRAPSGGRGPPRQSAGTRAVYRRPRAGSGCFVSRSSR